MTSPRLRRLMHDFNAVRAEYSGHDRVTIRTEGAPPPQIYYLELRVPSLRLVDGQPQIADVHEVEIRLPLGYPREPPYCIARTPVFHPNIDQHYCIGDYWAAGESLVDVIAKLADMLQYKPNAYNPGSPLNVTAARYALQHPDLFPLGDITVYQPEVEISLKPS
jgi:ubiquitin-protein ligase